MAPTKYDDKPEPGDLIEIFRGGYQHWAIYVGEGFVIHLAPPSEHAEAGANSVMSVLHEKARVKRDELWDVVGNDKYRINNLLDDEYEPRPIGAVIREAKSLVGRELPYCVLKGNCEHFVTELRYGKAQSRQVRRAAGILVGAGIAGMVGIGVVALAAAIFGSNKNDKQTK